MTDDYTTGQFSVDAAQRTVRGLLMPWREVSKLSASGQPPVAFDRGDLFAPEDVTVLNANMDHDRFRPVARFTKLEDTERGTVAEFSIASGPAGDRFLADHADKTKPKMKLSAEVRDIKRKSDGVFATATLTGAAFVPEGAFASAALFAVDALGVFDESNGIDPVEPEPVPVFPIEPEEGNITIIATQPPETVTVTVADQGDTIYSATTTEPPTEEEPPAVPEATATSQFGTPSAPANGGVTLSDVSRALGAYFGPMRNRGPLAAIEADAQMAPEAMFALVDIKTGGVGAAMTQPQWIGRLWAGRSYERRVIPLIGSAPLTSFKLAGFRTLVDPAMAAWAGDKANVPSAAFTTEPYTLNASKWAGGHDIAREFRDFDVPEFWEWYFQAMTDSYAKLSDDAALAALVAGATPVVAGAVPAGVSSGMVSIVDGALFVLDTGVPSFAVVAKDVFRQIALTRDDDQLAFLNTSLGLEEGTIANFRVVPHPTMAAGTVLVGVRNAATEYELPGSPIRTEALDQIKGGIDEALYGYSATVVDNAKGLALVTPAP